MYFFFFSWALTSAFVLVGWKQQERSLAKWVERKLICTM